MFERIIREEDVKIKEVWCNNEVGVYDSRSMSNVYDIWWIVVKSSAG